MSICVKMCLETIKHKLMTPQQDDLKKSMVYHGYKLWLTHSKLGDRSAKISGTVIEKPLVLIDSK